MDSVALNRLLPPSAVSADAVAAPSAAAAAAVSATSADDIAPGGPTQDADYDPGPFGDVGSDGNVVKRRAPIACRRCRRMRSKCLHDKATPPCRACEEAGLDKQDCVFPVRGQTDNDRDYRHPRKRAEKPVRREPTKIRRTILELPRSPVVKQNQGSPGEIWTELPPMEEITTGVECFTKNYFQLGFIPKRQFLERLQHQLVDPFLLLSILSISARLCPQLCARYRTGLRASEHFMERASHVAIGEVYKEPGLERCQAFYLLSIAQQGSGERNKSFINMGIAMRMATLMQLHREETYKSHSPPPDAVIMAESARRTLWMLHSQDSLHSSPLCPVSLAASDITALLPCNENDFTAGMEPISRAALEGTLPAVENPELIHLRERSLFATLMQVHHFWGTVSRRAVNFARSPRPWEPASDFSIMVNKLKEWEDRLHISHQWSRYNLKIHKDQGQDLAYLGATMVTRLCNIVVRRPYLIDIINLRRKQSAGHDFFSEMSTSLFENVHQLFEQIDAQFSGRRPEESVGAQMAAFCVYSCGLFSAYLCKYPNLCTNRAVASAGPEMLSRTSDILTECKEVWPLASRWLEALNKFSHDPKAKTLMDEGSMADGKDPVPDIMSPVSKPRAVQPFIEPTPPPPPSMLLPKTPEAQNTMPHPLVHTPPGDNLLPPLLTDNHGQMFQQVHHQAPLPPAAELPLHSPQAQQLNSHMFIPQAAAFARQSLEAMELVDPYTTQPPHSHQYDMAAGMQFYPHVGPTNDGFEGELQFHIDGALSWVTTNNAWMGPF